MKTLKTVEECCEYLGYDPTEVIREMPWYPEKDREALEAHAKRLIVVDAINRKENDGKEWFPDFTNWDERKYVPYFTVKSSSGFRCLDYDSWGTDSAVGSRLCFFSKAGLDHAIEHFFELFETEFVK